MFDATVPQAIAGLRHRNAKPSCHIVIGITHPQTCLTLTGRLRALREAGYRVTLISSPGELLNRTAAREGAEAIGLPMHREIAPLADVVSLVRLWWLLLRLKPDLTEFSTPKAGLLGNLASLFAGVPARVYMLRGLKLETASGVKRWILLAAERLAAACAQAVLCNSNSLRAEARALGVAPAAKLHLLNKGSSNGVDVDRFCPGPSDVRRRLGIPPKAPVVGFVGRLTSDKGLPELIEAFDSILEVESDAHLLLVGWFDASEDALSHDVRDRIDRNPRIHSTGFVEDTAPYYRAMDLMVLPTRREGFPNVVLEAAATGIPVITTIATGARDSVIPEVTGFLISPGSPQAIVDAVLTLLRKPATRLMMGKASRLWVLENFVDHYVLELAVAYYRSVMVSASAKTAPGLLLGPLGG